MQVADTGGMRTVVQQFQDESSRLAGVRQAAAYYGLALAALQRGDLATAEKNLQQASTGKRAAPALAKLAIDVAYARKDYAKALALSASAWQTWPDRYAIAMAYANALQQVGQGSQARTFLAARAKQWGNDEPAFYQLLAQSTERAGDAVQARLQMAQYYIRVGALDAAEAQLVQARSMSRDFYLQSQIDVQVQAVRESFAAQRQLLQRFQG
jgi:predicted Zn-dependent protease